MLLRYRRLIFTRFLETLCSPIFIAPPSHLTNQAVGSTYLPAALVRLVVDAFLDARIPLWPYESKSQINAMDKSPLLTEAVKRKLKATICVPDWIVFCTEEKGESQKELSNWVPSLGVISGGNALLGGLPPQTFSDPFQSHVDGEKFKKAVQQRLEELNWRTHAADELV